MRWRKISFRFRFSSTPHVWADSMSIAGNQSHCCSFEVLFMNFPCSKSSLCKVVLKLSPNWQIVSSIFTIIYFFQINRVSVGTGCIEASLLSFPRLVSILLFYYAFLLNDETRCAWIIFKWSSNHKIAVYSKHWSVERKCTLEFLKATS